MPINGQEMTAPQKALFRNMIVAGSGKTTQMPILVQAGDSISQMNGQRQTASYAFHALAKVPRACIYDPVIHNFGVPGATTGSSGTTNLTSPTNMAAIAAINPHVIEIIAGRNNSQGGDVNIASDILAFIDYIRAQPGCRTEKFGIHLVLPGTAGVGNPTALTGQVYYQVRQLTYAIANQRDGIVIFDPLQYALDQSTIFGPIGSSGGGVGAMLLDGVHPSPFLCSRPAVIDAYNDFLDKLGLPRAPGYRAVSRGDYYHATDNPLGNRLGASSSISNGSFNQAFSSFTGTGNSAGLTGNIPASAVVSATAADLVATLSQGTYTDPETGRAFPGLMAEMASPSPLAAERTLTCRLGATSLTGIDTTKLYNAQVLFYLEEPVGLIDFGLSLLLAGGTSKTIPFGANNSNSNETGGTKQCMEIYAGVTGLYILNVNGFTVPTGTTSMNFNLRSRWRAGSTPAGKIMMAQAGLWPIGDIPTGGSLI